MLTFQRPGKKNASDMDMTPLVDVVFTLLLFFVLAAAFTLRGLTVDLPSASVTKAIAGRVVEIRLAADGSFQIDGVTTARDDVNLTVFRLVQSFRSNPGQIVLLSDPQAPVEALIFLVDRIKANGGGQLMVAASAPRAEDRRR